MGKDKGWDYLGFNDKNDSEETTGSFYADDGSYETRYSDGSGFYHGSDGSYGSRYSDGSGYYHGSDGSYGSRYSDGSGYYHGADGSYGTRYSDGSGFFRGADGSYESRYSDGSGFYRGSDGEYKSWSSNDESFDSYINNDSESISGAEVLGGLIGAGIGLYAAHKSKKEQRILDEEIRQEIRRKKRNSFFKSHWRGVILVCLISIILLLGCLKYNDYKNRIIIGISSDELIGMNYEEAENTLIKAGFTNIHEKVIDDLSIDEIDDEGIITQVSIRGRIDFENINFSENDKFPYDAYIKLVYHELAKIEVPMSSKELKKLEIQVLKIAVV